MTSGTIRYRVVCDHPEQNRRYYVGDIDDSRLSGGGVSWEIYGGGYGKLAKQVNKRGSRTTTLPLVCGADGCGLAVELRDTSLPELLDVIAPQRDMLTTETGVMAGSEPWHIIPLRMLCEVVRLLRVRR